MFYVLVIFSIVILIKDDLRINKDNVKKNFLVMIWYDMLFYDMIWFMIWYMYVWYDMIWCDKVIYIIRINMRVGFVCLYIKGCILI